MTGGAGCLGANLVEHWLGKGHEMLVIDNFSTGAREAVPAGPGLTVVEGSVADRALVDEAFRRFAPELVVHGAAAYKDPADWREDAATNVLGAINVTRAAEAVSARRFVNFQTALCYGRPRIVPIPVDHPIAPFTSYGISKAAGEQFVLMGATPAVSLRLANVTGPRLAIGPIPAFYTRLTAGRSCTCTDTVRDFLDMSDFLALMDLVAEDGAPTGIFNVSTGEGHAIKEVYDQVAAYLGVALSTPVPIVPPGPDDVPAVVLDPAVTEARFGWKARVGFAAALRRQLDWYAAHGVSEVYSHLTPRTPSGAA